MSKENVDEKGKTRTLIIEGVFARLIIETGPEKGKEFLIDKPCVTIGRHLENDVCLSYDEKISRFHGRISFIKDEEVYYYEDLNSTNGTTICNKWFKNGRVKIKHGNRILIGKGIQLGFFTKKPGLMDWLLG